MKKGKIILIFICVIILCSSVPIILGRQEIKRKIEFQKQQKIEKEKEEKMLLDDQVAPILILTQDKLNVYQGDEINYKSFIKEASDNLEGDLTKNVKYEEIDTTKIGEYFIEYEVIDKASNITKAKLQIIVKEKPNFKY